MKKYIIKEISNEEYDYYYFMRDRIKDCALMIGCNEEDIIYYSIKDIKIIKQEKIIYNEGFKL